MANTYHNILKAGTQAAYDALETKDASVLYFCTDSKKIYKGAVDFTESVLYVSTKPSTPVAGKVYIIADTNTVEAYTGSAWRTISYALTTSITASSTDAQVASAKSIYDFVTGAISDLAGSENTVSKVELKKNGEDVVAGTLVITKADESTSDLALNGVATKPTWDSTARKLTIPVVGDDDVEIEIGKDLVVKSGTYDHANEQIVLTLNNDETIQIPVADLIDEIQVSDTSSIDLTYDKSTNTVSGVVRISTASGNALTVNTTEGTEGLYISLGNYYTKSEVDSAIGDVSDVADAADTLSKANKAALDILNGAASTPNSVANLIAAQASTQAGIDSAQNGRLDALETASAATDDNVAALATATTAWGTF